MAFISTLDSLYKRLASNIDLSNYATKTELNSKANTSDLATIATSGSYNDLDNKPTLFSGSYNDLTNKPALFSGDYEDLDNKPSLFSGSYNDLDNKPTLFSGSYNDLTNKPTLFSGDYADLTNKPTIPDTSNFVTNTTLTTKLAKSLEKSITVTATNNTFTIDPNDGALFIVSISANSTIELSTLDSDFTITGSVLTILIGSSDPSYTVSWPSNILWKDGTAPDLSESEVNLVTLTAFNNFILVGGSVPIIIPDTGDS